MSACKPCPGRAADFIDVINYPSLGGHIRPPDPRQTGKRGKVEEGEHDKIVPRSRGSETESSTAVGL